MLYGFLKSLKDLSAARTVSVPVLPEQDKLSSKIIVHNKTSLPEKNKESKPLQHVNISDLLTAHKKGGRDA